MIEFYSTVCSSERWELPVQYLPCASKAGNSWTCDGGIGLYKSRETIIA